MADELRDYRILLLSWSNVNVLLNCIRRTASEIVPNFLGG